MEIQINNAENVIKAAEELLTANTELDSIAVSFETIQNEVAAYWAQENPDAEYFGKNNKEYVEKLKGIVECNKEFGTSISSYAQQQQKTSQQTVA